MCCLPLLSEGSVDSLSVFSSTCATARRLENLLDALQNTNKFHKVEDMSHVVPRSGSLSVRGLES